MPSEPKTLKVDRPLRDGNIDPEPKAPNGEHQYELERRMRWIQQSSTM